MRHLPSDERAQRSAAQGREGGRRQESTASPDLLGKGDLIAAKSNHSRYLKISGARAEREKKKQTELGE